MAIEEKVAQWQVDQSSKLNDEVQKSNDHFRELWQTDLALLRSEEGALWDKERRSLREDEVCTSRDLFFFFQKLSLGLTS